MTGKRSLRGTGPLGYVAAPEQPPCPLCGRPLPNDRTVDEHHLTPKSQGGKSAERIHRICHRKIHATFNERELASQFNTWPSLKAHTDIANFIRWVASKDPSYYDNSRRSRRAES
jgi:DNA repair exonuclease SbcCD ATPase subunit